MWKIHGRRGILEVDAVNTVFSQTPRITLRTTIKPPVAASSEEQRPAHRHIGPNPDLNPNPKSWP